jgi:gamma-glutamyltranspeptidase/glutathione hydrolase
MKWAFRDRAVFLGDPDFVSIPVTRLISKQYAAGFREQVREDTVLVLGEGSARVDSKRHTSHISVVDRWGNAVAITQTVNLNFGSGLTVPGTGIVLNDQMDDFASLPGVPNAFGLVGSEANSIAAGKRPLSNMTPTIVTKDGSVVLVLGSPGGPKIITSVLQVMLNVLDHGMGVSDAVAAPRIHHQWMPDSLYVEKIGFGKDVLENLRVTGHALREREQWSSVQAIFVEPATGYYFGTADKRLEGNAAGY